jgi:hypothetical protein
MNVADTELMFGVLLRDGYERTDVPDDADVMLVNTCAVRDNAEQRVVGRVGELMRYKRAGDVLGVVGCMAQRLGPTLLARVPRVDLVRGRRLPQSARAARAGRGGRGWPTPSSAPWEHYEDVPPVRDGAPTQSSPCSAAAITSAPSASFRTRADPSAVVTGRRSGEVPGSCVRGQRDHAAGPDGQQLS